MDQKLVAWGRAVKARQKRGRPPFGTAGSSRWSTLTQPSPGGRGLLPPLWLFTDASRMGVEAAVAALPAGLCGVVFRHDDAGGRGALLRIVARVCRARRLALVVAGDASGAPGLAGRHLRRGFGAGSGLVTSSAHGMAELVRARRAGAAAVFLSPVFATESHAGARTLGPVRWAAMARRAGLPVFALGGMTGRTARRVPRWAAGAGAIGALLP